ncbi:hypothetical protein LF1_35650 [Rubripirellula obstinata]|uniref:Lipoprotein n=1 Tax=Rubripirellula obstinata TaxID=406547 RepID=A0A5B1CL16_9BACT|nr:hypothetical protein [Rubripirellula obstinata]KAA1261022.1 hypothetical protein LF1_35650 [Rubripirellula obstinata]
MTVRSNLRCYFGRFEAMLVLLGIGTASLVGCGSNASSDATNGLASVGQSAAVAQANETDVPTIAPTDVVSQFLDLVRRGGSDSGASTLLTTKAQSELNRIGRTVQPIGSPDARFVVTRAESVPENPGATLVHSIWKEPGVGSSLQNADPASGESSADNAILEYQVVWALQKEANQWRISGLAMEIDPNQNPLIVNFEDGNRMAALLAETESVDQSDNSGSKSAGNSNPAATNAAVEDSTLNR